MLANFRSLVQAEIFADFLTASERGQMKIGKPPATFRMLFEERWQGQVSELLNEPYRKGERRD